MRRIVLGLLVCGLCIAGTQGIAFANGKQSVKIDEFSVSLPAGTNNIGDFDLASSIPTGTNVMGSVAISAINVSIPAGNNNIGDFDLASSIPAGNNNIGDFDLASSIPAGVNNIGSVAISAFNVSLPAGDNNIGNVDLASSIPAGTNNIGDVDIASSIPAGNNNIGDFDLASSIPAGANTVGSVTMLGNLGVQIKQDAAGQIYAIASQVAGDTIEKTYVVSNIATGAWIGVASHTVTTAKSGKIDGVVFTGGYDMEYKISDGTALRDIYGQTSPASPAFTVSNSRPLAKVAGTVITVYAKSSEAVNAGTIRLSIFEYTP